MREILGIAYRRGAPVVKRSFRIDENSDRGPDNTAHVDYGPVEFFHTRLAVIDQKQTSNQPIASEDGQLAMMCNGEIYNHLSLREKSSYRYRTGSDCEANVAVYSASGTDGFRQLDGMYATALYDKREQVLILHRDEIGKKPLFWYFDEDEIIFSSNVHAISSNLRKSPKFDLEQIRHYFQNGFVHPSHSIFHGIRPVLPGEIIRVHLRTGKIDRAWLDIQDHFDGFNYSDAKTVQSQIEYLIENAAQKRIRGLTRPVIMFSGGIDTTVVATACKQTGGGVLMTLKQPLPWLNDEPFAKQEARRLGQSLVFAEPWRNFDKKSSAH